MSVTLIDGSVDFSGGVNSIKVPTIAGQENPNGLARNELAWLNNATVRDGGITQRTGYRLLGTIDEGGGLYQGGFMYEPDFFENPYLILSIGGRIYKVIPDLLGSVTDLSAAFGLTNPPDVEQAYFCQGEKYLINQAGDNTTLPLFWDGASLRRSKGITNTAVAPGTPGVNEIPAATAMDYYMGRLWYAQGRQYSAGDIVGGPSGTLANRFRDAILNVTENPLVLGGDGFTVPTNAGNIRALKHNANLDSVLGQGQLFVFTRKAVYATTVPVTRSDWIAADSSNAPLQKVIQLVNGSVNDRCIIPVNGDLFYQSLEPSIRSIISALRYFNQWGNIQISANEQRILQFNDRALLHGATGVYFDNRLWQSALPRTTVRGIGHDALVPLDFVPLSSFGGDKQPVWEGMGQGLVVLQCFSGNFGGLERSFMICVSKQNTLQLWEMTSSERTDMNASGEERVTWQIEFPAYNWSEPFALKKLVSAELWIDKLFGKVEFTMEYRPDSDPCWKLWHKWDECTARNSCEDAINPVCYPLDTYRESFRSTVTLSKPPESAESFTGRPTYIAYQIQPRLTITGWCRVRALLLHAERWQRRLYENMAQ